MPPPPRTFEANSWSVPLKPDKSPEEICRIRIRPETGEPKTFEADRYSPSDKLWKEVSDWLSANPTKRFRLESLNGASEPLGSKTYYMPATEPMTEFQKTAISADSSAAVVGIVNMAEKMGKALDTVGGIAESMAESLRKSRNDPPQFMIDQLRQREQRIEDLQKKLQQAETERDVALVMVQKATEGKTSSTAVEILREVNTTFNKAQPSIPDMLKKMLEAVKSGKLQDLLNLLRGESDESRAEIIANVVVAGLAATDAAKRNEWQALVLEKVQAKVDAASKSA